MCVVRRNIISHLSGSVYVLSMYFWPNTFRFKIIFLPVIWENGSKHCVYLYPNVLDFGSICSSVQCPYFYVRAKIVNFSFSESSGNKTWIIYVGTQFQSFVCGHVRQQYNIIIPHNLISKITFFISTLDVIIGYID